jgi:hypothetical protein
MILISYRYYNSTFGLNEKMTTKGLDYILSSYITTAENFAHQKTHTMQDGTYLILQNLDEDILDGLTQLSKQSFTIIVRNPTFSRNYISAFFYLVLKLFINFWCRKSSLNRCWLF